MLPQYQQAISKVRERERRDKAIMALRLKKWTLRRIAARHALTQEGVRQILKRMGLK